MNHSGQITGFPADVRRRERLQSIGCGPAAPFKWNTERSHSDFCPASSEA
jgi:hypothetical protein